MRAIVRAADLKTNPTPGTRTPLKLRSGWLPYMRLALYLIPLSFSLFIKYFNLQLFNRTLTAVPRSTETIAAFGLAWYFVQFVVSWGSQVKQLALAKATGPRSLLQIERYVLRLSLTLTGGLVLCCFSPIGAELVRLHGIDPTQRLGETVLTALRALSWRPFLECYRFLNMGVLLRVKQTHVISYASVVEVVATALSASVLIFLNWFPSTPVIIPIVAYYAGIASQIPLLRSAVNKHKHLLVYSTVQKSDVVDSFRELSTFYFPLGITKAADNVVRPVLNMYIGHLPGSEESLAVLTVVFPLANMIYGWVNDIRSLPVAFQDVQLGTHTHMYYIRRFSAGFAGVTFGIMAVSFWTGLRDIILERVIGVEPTLAALCANPLAISPFLSLLVSMRSYLHGMCLYMRRTEALVASGPARLLVTVLACISLPWFLPEVHGATLGMLAYLLGFCTETLVVAANLVFVHKAARKQMGLLAR